ncbi:MAG: hypothetical protein M3Y48_15335 [Actinomycetota bacterium]|nr:hypothetical protein [Actinomycetota bacterium]
MEHASTYQGVSAEVTWISTGRVEHDGEDALTGFDGLVIAPGSPYRSLLGALAAIQYARIHDVPLLGTCGGFQHVVLESTRNVVGFSDAQHAEYDFFVATLFVPQVSSTPTCPHPLVAGLVAASAGEAVP